MSLSGYVSSVAIRDENDPDNIAKYTANDGVYLELKKKNDALKLSIKCARDDDPDQVQNIDGYYLDDCTYEEESSVPGHVETIYVKSQKKTVTISDKKKECQKLLEKVRTYLLNKDPEPSPPSPQPSPSPTKPKRKPKETTNENVDVKELIRALNENNIKDAGELAGKLAQKKQPVQFGLVMNNESGNKQPAPKKVPVVEPIKLKMSIETFMTEPADNAEYDIAVLPGTKLKDLKDKVHESTNIPVNQQCWFINRDLLGNDYEFGKSWPTIRENTVLILYITRPQNN